MLLLTLRGTPTLYYGDELGMVDVEVPPTRVVDPDGRDPERSPMPWTGAPGRGFCADGVEPWLPFGDAALNVEAQEADPRSMLALHRRLLALRRSSEDLLGGRATRRGAGAGVLAYRRGRGDRGGAEPRPTCAPTVAPGVRARCVLDHRGCEAGADAAAAGARRRTSRALRSGRRGRRIASAGGRLARYGSGFEPGRRAGPRCGSRPSRSCGPCSRAGATWRRGRCRGRARSRRSRGRSAPRSRRCPGRRRSRCGRGSRR